VLEFLAYGFWYSSLEEVASKGLLPLLHSVLDRAVATTGLLLEVGSLGDGKY
jgi:hypothetical protein